MRIAVVYGGVSAERAVSIASGTQVLEALLAGGEDAFGLLLDEELPGEGALEQMYAADAVFLALHGGAGEDGRLQRALERRGIYHYTGTGPQGSALAMNKDAAKRAVAACGVRVGKWEICEGSCQEAPLPFPFVRKPRDGGSSVGLCVVRSQADWCSPPPGTGPLLCEEYLPGREFSVGVLGHRALPPVEICTPGGLYDYAHKYTKGAAQELCPAPISTVRRAELQNLALASFAALGLRDYARIDFKEDGGGALCFLEANTLPGMTECSLLPLAGSVAGYGMGALCLHMASMAATRRDLRVENPGIA